MSNPYVGEIRMFAGSFAPAGWQFCNGQLMPISENETLFQLLGTTYGGDGQETFALPNLQSRIPLHHGNGPDGITYQLAEASGTESVTLTTQQIPNHSHPFSVAALDGTQNNPGNQVLAQTPAGINFFFEDPPTASMAASSVTPAGGSQPHDNLQPFLCINFIISMFGVFPSPT